MMGHSTNSKPDLLSDIRPKKTFAEQVLEMDQMDTKYNVDDKNKKGFRSGLHQIQCATQKHPS